ncbi:Mpr protein [Pseudomonas synxantha]|uniref:Mpr protein n=1 Tax=Pseudomonas synxantha TaxID=47883 RepID=A0A3G7U8I9_9PSED|nr:Mpr protein [Pseudomonas synxantha]
MGLREWGKPGLSGRIQCVECVVPLIDAKELVEVPPEALVESGE